MARDQGIHGAAEAVRLEQELEDEILTAARAARGDRQELQKLDAYVRRDRRSLSLITGLLGGGVRAEPAPPTQK